VPEESPICRTAEAIRLSMELVWHFVNASSICDSLEGGAWRRRKWYQVQGRSLLLRSTKGRDASGNPDIEPEINEEVKQSKDCDNKGVLQQTKRKSSTRDSDSLRA